MKTIFAWFGGGVALLWFLGAIGCTEFRLYQGSDPYGCTKMESKARR